MSNIVFSPFASKTFVTCFNANPAIERTCQLEHFEVGTVNRIQSYLDTPSGKAAIVARAIQNLGFNALQVGPLAGSVGERFKALCEEEDLPGDWVWVDGQTRTNLTIVTRHGVPDTIVNEAGPSLTQDQWAVLKATLLLNSTKGVPLCISGSMPQGVTPTNLTELVGELRELGVPVFVDSSGWGLEALLAGTPWCAKFNQDEAAALLGRELQNEHEVASAAIELLAQVDELIVITMGSKGAVIASRDLGVAHVIPPKIDMISGVGSGDTFLAALVVGLYFMGLGEIAAVEFASAAGALNATQAAQGVIDMDGVQVLVELVETRIMTPASEGN